MLAQQLDIPEILARILANRHIHDVQEAEAFLDPKLRHLMPNPFEMKDMDKAVQRIVDAVINNERICIFGDYDVDGATSTALLRTFFRDLKVDVEIYIPNRFTEGYGPNAPAFRKLKDSGVQLVITVDCGAVSHEPLAKAKEYGLDVVVIDHHIGGPELPEAWAVVNPNRFDETFPHNNIAAVGVAFLVSVAVRSRLRELNWFDYNHEPDMMKYLDLVALGTVCDVMPLRGLNRAFVSQGLKLIAARRNVGIATLGNVAKIDTRPHSYHLGYVMGPRINAGGRAGHGMLGAELLSCTDPAIALELATKLEELNNERKTIEALAFENAIREIEVNGMHEKPIIFSVGQEWHQGILGILASRLKERYGRPSAVISIVDGVGKGSIRSITGVDIGQVICRAKSQGLLLEGGGHSMAGGFSVDPAKLNNLHEYFIQEVGQIEESLIEARRYKIDSILALGGVNRELFDTIALAQPFGSGNPQPKFAIFDVSVIRVSKLGGANLSVIVGEKKSGGVFETMKCVAFRCIDTPLGNFLVESLGKKINIAGTIQLNYWDENKVDFVIDDVSISTT
jgi:single-stranded-DNA-specific exonuclease